MRTHKMRKISSKNSKKRTMRCRLQTENLEQRTMLAGDVVAATDADLADVNQDGQVGPIDALMVVSHLVEQQAGNATFNDRLDVNTDGSVSPLDALMVMNSMDRGNDGRQAGDEQADPERDGERMERRRGDVVLSWNNLFNEILVENVEDQNPGFASRAMAMLNLAIYDAVSLAADGEDASTFYDYDTAEFNGNIKADVATSHAAYTVLSSLYPEQQATIDDFMERQVRDRRGGGGDRPASADVGAMVGETVLAERGNDGADATVEYNYTDEIGYFQADPLNPDVPVWGPGWGEVVPFSISSAETFAPETTPPLDSVEYANSYNEVLELGSVESDSRTADQTEAGIFWAYDREGLGTPLSLFNDVLESVAVQERNTLEENAALFAQASVSMADAAIVAWHTKFSEEFWRPVTAIHDGDLDGNPLTAGDAEWTALGAPDGGDDVIGFTPQFPTYISGHATFGGALFGALQEFYGTDDISFDVTSNELEILLEDPALQEAYGLDLDDATRSFDSFSEAMAENGRSRVYLGIHFDFDDTVGQAVGQNVASTIASQFVVPSNDGPRNDGNGGGDNGNGNNGNGGGNGPRRSIAPRPQGLALDAVAEVANRIDGVSQPTLQNNDTNASDGAGSFSPQLNAGLVESDNSARREDSGPRRNQPSNSDRQSFDVIDAIFAEELA